MTPVVVYATRSCPYCVGARRLLAELEIPYEEIAVDEQPEKRVEMRQRGGGHTVPQIWIGETHVGGFTELLALDRSGRLAALLD